jgi:hypothetical protein
MAESETIEYPPLAAVTREEVEIIADHLFSLGISNVTAITHRDQHTLVTASRVMRMLLSAYERANGRTLSCLMLAGGC